MRVLSSIFALCTLVLAVLGLYDVKDVGGFDNTDWMSGIDDSTYISDISIPGSHDSVAFYEPIEAVAKCQSYSLRDQLDMGVRFIDIRAFMLFGEAKTSHGVILQGMDLQEVFDTCYDFLEDNPSETIILSLKEDGSVMSDASALTEFTDENIKANPEKWYTADRIPLMEELRGKILLFNRYDALGGCGIIASGFEGWKDDASFEIRKEEHVLFIQDKYKLGDTEGVDEMWEEAKLYFELASAGTNGYSRMYLNYLSGHVGLIANVKGASDIINPRFLEYIDEGANGCHGIVIMDFVDPQLCEAVIGLNF